MRYDIEEFTVQGVIQNDLECFFDCLSYMPKLRILNFSYVPNSPIQNILFPLLKKFSPIESIDGSKSACGRFKLAY